MTSRIDLKRAFLAALTGGAVVLALVLVAGGSPASATHIAATGPVGDNCVEFQVDATGTKSPKDFPDVDIALNSWDPDDIGFTFTVSGLVAGQFVDISVKSGQDIEELGPYLNGTHKVDTVSPHANSHVRLCVFGEPTPPEPGNIIVKKEVTQGSATDKSFVFTASYDGDGFSLSHGQSNDSGDLTAGTYSVSETVPTGWTLQSATCDHQSDPSSISLQEGETVTCTFVNAEDAPPPAELGKIVVVKEVTEGSATDKSFVFTASYDGDGFSLSDGQSNDSGDLTAGTYLVSETVPEGWQLKSETCSDGSDPSSISLQEGETVTCTFENHEIPDEVSPTSIVSTTTTIVSTTAEVSVETLPFTGFESGTAGLLALALVASGALALVGTRVFRGETDE